MKNHCLRGLLISCLLLLSISVNAQVITPVKWSFSTKQLNPGEVELVFRASIDKTWHLYSQETKPDGPLPTNFIFEESDKFSRTGKVSEPSGKEEYDPVFEMNVKYFNEEAVFKQKIKVLSKDDFILKGAVEFQACDDKACIFDEKDFEFKIKGNPQAGAVAQVNTPSQNKPVDTIVNITDSVTSIAPSKDTVPGAETSAEIKAGEKKENFLLWFFIISFGSGLIALVTPCVFPMIPMTVSFFLKEPNKRKAKMQALTFGFSIILIYTLIGSILAMLFGAAFANFISTHWIPNILFFLIFLVFAASFLGMFEITLPSWVINKADAQADRGGLIGSFFMAFTLVLVSFSCTGPIVASILVESSKGQILMPIVGMLGYSLAFAMPFTIFAFIPRWLNSMKSGGWLNSVKVVLGFIELALGLKFLSVADQTYHWGILDREIYLAFWIIIFTLMGFYLLGKLKFAHDSEVKFISVPRLTFAIITFTFVLYLLPGMFGAPLKALSGYLPPQTTHDFDLNKIIRENVEIFSGSSTSSNKIEGVPDGLCDVPKYNDILHLPHGLKGYFDYEQGLACAKKLDKPVFIDFTGHGCVNCREMEARVWSDPQVLKRLKDDFVVIALYVDDKTKLPESEWINSKYDGKVKKTIGKKYADFQISRFNVNAQPYYVLLDTNGELLVPPKAYDLNVNNFVQFLDAALAEFKKR